MLICLSEYGIMSAPPNYLYQKRSKQLYAIRVISLMFLRFLVLRGSCMHTRFANYFGNFENIHMCKLNYFTYKCNCCPICVGDHKNLFLKVSYTHLKIVLSDVVGRNGKLSFDSLYKLIKKHTACCANCFV